MSLLLSDIWCGKLLMLHTEAETFSVLESTLDRTQQLQSGSMLIYSHSSVAQLTSLCSMFRLECLIPEPLLITQQEYNTPPLTFSVLTHVSFNVLILNPKIKILLWSSKKYIQVYKGFMTIKPLRCFYFRVIKRHSIKISSCISFRYLFLD